MYAATKYAEECHLDYTGKTIVSFFLFFFAKSYQLFVHRWKNNALQEKNTITTVKHKVGLVMFWGCFTLFGTRRLESVQGTMK